MGHGKKGMGKMKRRRKKSEVGRGKSTSITGQAIVQGNVEVLARGLASAQERDAPPRRSDICLRSFNEVFKSVIYSFKAGV